VIDESPASKQDIRLDDLILFVDRKPVRSIREVNAALSNIDRDRTISIVLRRGEQVLTKRLSRLDDK
jgi:S1-C subfamily serine protease